MSGMGYPFDNSTVVVTIATNQLSKEGRVPARREIEVEASPEEVWDALSSD